MRFVFQGMCDIMTDSKFQFLGKKSRVGQARWVTVFTLLITILIKLLTESGYSYENEAPFSNTTQQLIHCAFNAYSHSEKLSDCVVVNISLMNENLLMRKLSVLKQTSSSSSNLKKVLIYVAIIGNSTTNAEQVRSVVEHRIIFPKLDIFDCGTVIESAKGNCSSS